MRFVQIGLPVGGEHLYDIPLELNLRSRRLRLCVCMMSRELRAGSAPKDVALLNSMILFAQIVQDGAKDAAENAATEFWRNPIVLQMTLMAVFFFVVVLPGQRRRAKEQEQLMSGLKNHDEVVTASGIIGTVYNIKEGGDEVVLKVDDNARIRVLKSSIVRILKKDETPTTAAAPTTPANTNIKPNA